MKCSTCGTSGRSRAKDDEGSPVTRSDHVGAVPEAYLASAHLHEAEGAAREALEWAERPLADRCRATLVALD